MSKSPADNMLVKKCPVTTMLNHLRRWAGLPVPVVFKWVDGKPDFRLLEPERVVQCVQKRQCAVCGKPLGDWAYYIGGPLCLANRLFNDAAMHLPCAKASMQLCPFLTGQRQHYREAGLPSTGLMDTAEGRPATMYLMRAWTLNQKFVPVGGTLAISSGPLKIVEEF